MTTGNLLQDLSGYCISRHRAGRTANFLGDERLDLAFIFELRRLGIRGKTTETLIL